MRSYTEIVIGPDEVMCGGRGRLENVVMYKLHLIACGSCTILNNRLACQHSNIESGQEGEVTRYASCNCLHNQYICFYYCENLTFREHQSQRQQIS